MNDHHDGAVIIDTLFRKQRIEPKWIADAGRPVTASNQSSGVADIIIIGIIGIIDIFVLVGIFALFIFFFVIIGAIRECSLNDPWQTVVSDTKHFVIRRIKARNIGTGIDATRFHVVSADAAKVYRLHRLGLFL